MKTQTQSQSALSIDQRQRYANINAAILQRNADLKQRYNALHPDYEQEHKDRLKAYNETYY
jgi:hypothetical protein